MDLHLRLDAHCLATTETSVPTTPEGWQAALVTVTRQLRMPELQAVFAGSRALLESPAMLERMLALHAPGAPVTASFVPWPAASFAGEALRPEEIEAAPSLPAKKLPIFRAWRVDNLTPSDLAPTKPAATVQSDRVRLTRSLGSPDGRGWVAIAAKAVAEGKLSPGDLKQVMLWSTAEAAGLTRRNLEVLALMADGLSLTEIGRRTGMGHGAAWTHARTIGHAMGVEGPLTMDEPRRAALEEAHRRGLVDHPPQAPAPPPPRAPAPALAASREATLKAWLVEGEAPTDEAVRRQVSESTVYAARSLLAGHLGVTQDSDWAAALSRLGAAGELSLADVARAAAWVIRNMRAGPEAVWRPLLSHLVEQGAIGLTETTALRCRLRMDEAGVAGRAAALMDALNVGHGRPALDADFPGDSLVKHANTLRKALGITAPWDAGRGAAAIVSAARAAGIVPFPATAVRDGDVATIRSWHVDGQTLEAAGKAQYVSEATVQRERSELEARLHIEMRSQWAPVLHALMDDGRLEVAEMAKALRRLGAQTGTGPAQAWHGLVDALVERRELTESDAAELKVAFRAGALGLTPGYRSLLKHLARGDSYEASARAMGVDDRSLSTTLTRLARQLGVPADPSSTAPIADLVLVAAHRQGVLAPNHSEAVLQSALLWERAQGAGVFLTSSQARLLRDLNAGLPIAQVQAAQGSAFDQAVNRLRAVLGVARRWEGGLGAQAIVAAGRQAGLLEVVPWPDSAADPRRFLGVMSERFGIMRGQYDLLQALAAEPSGDLAGERLRRAAQAVDTSVATAEAMVVQMARRLEVSGAGTSYERLAEALRDWCAGVGLHAGSSPEEREEVSRRTDPRLRASQINLLITLQARPTMAQVIETLGGDGYRVMRAMELLERRLGVLRDFGGAADLVDQVLASARQHGIVGSGEAG